jgi:hypothetical protein
MFCERAETDYNKHDKFRFLKKNAQWREQKRSRQCYTINLKLKVMKPLHVILAVVGGVIAGAAVGLLFAPEKGSDMRAKIADYLRSKKIKLKKDQLDELTEEISKEL